MKTSRRKQQQQQQQQTVLKASLAPCEVNKRLLWKPVRRQLTEQRAGSLNTLFECKTAAAREKHMGRHYPSFQRSSSLTMPNTKEEGRRTTSYSSLIPSTFRTIFCATITYPVRASVQEAD